METSKPQEPQIEPETVVTTLPGFDGDLPFYLETGYIGVGESNESQLFYYFVESQRSPALDPLMLWLTGGPGCSVLSAFFYESGPVAFDYSNYNGSLPSLHLNPFAWTQWLLDHPQYLTNQLFIGGDSYSGIPLPIVVQNILDGNEAGVPPTMNLKGYILGNPKTDDFIDENSVVPFVHRLTLISNELYKSTKEDCGGDYVNINASNTDCVSDINTIDELILQINLMQVLEPICQTAKPRARGLRRIGGRRSLNEEDLESISISKLNSAYWCREYNYVLSGVWANDKSVRDALQVRENTTGVWKRCNASLAYTKDVSSTVDYHRNLSKQSLRALIYSGDHDLSVPHIGTENWIHSLDLTTNEYWRPWFVDGQVAGYTEKYMNGDFTLIYATVKMNSKDKLDVKDIAKSLNDDLAILQPLSDECCIYRPPERVPFFILEELFKFSNKAELVEGLSMIKLTRSFFEGCMAYWVTNDEEKDFSQVKHFIDFLRNCQLPQKKKRVKRTNKLVIPTATELYHAGVKFEMHSSRNKLDIEFDKGILKIPHITMSNGVGLLLRNVLIFENCHYDDGSGERVLVDEAMYRDVVAAQFERLTLGMNILRDDMNRILEEMRRDREERARGRDDARDRRQAVRNIGEPRVENLEGEVHVEEEFEEERRRI
ncbi:hypothetical protein GH714_003297 [Hevea brasiliensis]|uniref:Uncharacterized protein n=1 Tax=Hevea brasiliensis TaxID=3981 RepID=A0A6A6MAG5_HEVBR|nr:hypothetical protein GH714_003297 [Hevea brasiliensis]